MLAYVGSFACAIAGALVIRKLLNRSLRGLRRVECNGAAAESGASDALCVLRRCAVAIDAHKAISQGALLSHAASLRFDKPIIAEKHVEIVKKMCELSTVQKSFDVEFAIADMCACYLEHNTCTAAVLKLASEVGVHSERLTEAIDFHSSNTID